MAAVTNRGIALPRSPRPDTDSDAVSPTTTPVPSPSTLDQRNQAEQDMWNWYLDWAKIARTVVRNKSHRIRRGVSQPTQGEPNVELPAEDLTVVPTPAPAPTPGPAPTPAI